jgi:hypothetical protein
MVIEHAADLEQAWAIVVFLYPPAASDTWPSPEVAAKEIVSGQRVATTAMGQGDNEPDAAYCLRYVLTLLAEQTDAP